ncbi:MAG: heme exporter protein CcmB [Ostreibacterium sp.]
MSSLIRKEWLLAIRRLHEILQPIFFLIILMTLFPITLGTDRILLIKIAPGVIWVGILLSILLSSEKLYKNDYEDGSLEQLYLSSHNRLLTVAAKLIVQWFVQILPILLALPLLGVLYGLSLSVIGQIALTIIIGSPSLLLLAMLGSAITLAIARGGLLLILIILPFYIPTLIFALSAISAYVEGFSNLGQLAILGAILMMMITVIPFAIVVAIRVSLAEG